MQVLSKTKKFFLEGTWAFEWENCYLPKKKEPGNYRPARLGAVQENLVDPPENYAKTWRG